ncbi:MULTISPECIES: hypothetical protein [Sporolactobacillus]|nr:MULTISPECIES: hypothetical protein [Sporolactobacillus]QAA23772.1 hypothetical protein C0674_14910 [Sporolactobacillus terrae]QAA26743.1 hypothetical protein C0679_14895 [Sporolactobacillus terrae]
MLHATDGSEIRARFGQICWLKGWTSNGVRFSIRDLHNTVPNDNYPDFYAWDAGSDHFETEAWDYTYGAGFIMRLCPLYDFNVHRHGSGYRYLDGSKYGLNEGVNIYDNNGNNFGYIGKDCKILIPNGNYGYTPSWDVHGKIFVSGWQYPDGDYHLQSGFIDHDPTQWPSEHGLNTW